MIIEDNLINLKIELSNAVVTFDKGENGYRLFFNNHSGFQEFKSFMNHLYYEFVKEMQKNLIELDSQKESQIYLEMLMHLFELLDEQIGTYPDFVTPHRKTKMVSGINAKASCIHTNPDNLNQLLIYFQHQKKMYCKGYSDINVYSWTRNELVKKLTTRRTFSGQIFKYGGSKYLENKPSLDKMACKILNIEDFPLEDPKVLQWRFVIVTIVEMANYFGLSTTSIEKSIVVLC